MLYWSYTQNTTGIDNNGFRSMYTLYVRKGADALSEVAEDTKSEFFPQQHSAALT